jgi:hypothetical protein
MRFTTDLCCARLGMWNCCTWPSLLLLKALNEEDLIGELKHVLFTLGTFVQSVVTTVADL